MSDIHLAPVCGLYCGDCGFLGKECSGCGKIEGKPFWTALAGIKICPLYECCKNRKQLEHCGFCEELPCSIFLELRDPAMSDDEFKESLKSRQKELKRRAEIGTDSWLKEKKNS